MSLTPSSMIPLGTTAPDFTLPDTVSGRSLALADIRGARGALIMFICNHCPFVIHIQDALARLGEDYADSGIGIAAISSNDSATYPQDGPEQMKKTAEKLGYKFPYLHDETQDVARAYGAVCTPDFFLFDAELRCAYRGQFDGARPGKDLPATGEDVRRAMELLLAGQPVPADTQLPSVGCSIKWR